MAETDQGVMHCCIDLARQQCRQQAGGVGENLDGSGPDFIGDELSSGRDC